MQSLTPITEAGVPSMTFSEASLGFRIASSDAPAVGGTTLASPTAVPDVLYHYTSAGAAGNIAKEGLALSTTEKLVYATPNGGLTPIQAQIDLNLGLNRGVPSALLQIDARGLQNSGVTPVLGPRLVTGGNSGAGGGTEVIYNQKIDPKFIKRVW
ncbi:MAG: hypothetical protein Q8937_16940 [Bacteroidota bacterium]|nr:hypothetical protein [Bacteroidota bacterium]